MLGHFIHSVRIRIFSILSASAFYPFVRIRILSLLSASAFYPFCPSVRPSVRPRVRPSVSAFYPNPFFNLLVHCTIKIMLIFQYCYISRIGTHNRLVKILFQVFKMRYYRGNLFLLRFIKLENRAEIRFKSGKSRRN
jgi:hypothetical protein